LVLLAGTVQAQVIVDPPPEQPTPVLSHDTPAVSDALIRATLQPNVRARLHPHFEAVLARHRSQAREERGLMGPEVFHDAIVHTAQAGRLTEMGIHLNSEWPGFVTTRVTTSQLDRLAEAAGVTYLEPGSINAIEGDIAVAQTGAPYLHEGWIDNENIRGEGVIVLVYDTGIDWQHLDFRHPTDTLRSRILRIWDQTIDPTGPYVSPQGMNYGAEFTREHIESALRGEREALPTSDVNGHGTHVAGSAAGSSTLYHGMAPEASIVVVKGGNAFFSEARMIDGLTYAELVAAHYDMPVVVNWSIGGRTGPRDGTRAYEMAVDEFSRAPGHAVVIAAGNDGSRAIHRSGRVPVGGEAAVRIVVPSYSPTPGRNNDAFALDTWMRSDAAVQVIVRTPTGETYTSTGTTVEHKTAEGAIRIINAAIQGRRNVHVRVYDDDPDQPPAQGTWEVKFSGTTSAIDFDSWLSEWVVGGSVSASLEDGDTDMTITMPATSHLGIAVASYVTRWAWAVEDGAAYTYSTAVNRLWDRSTFSGRGPTRDGRMKPDLAAPGQGIIAASSRHTVVADSRLAPGGQHHVSQGTSMAAPHVAGAVALLLSVDPDLTALQLRSLLNHTAVADAFTGPVPDTDWGHGKLDVLAAVLRAIDAPEGGRHLLTNSSGDGGGILTVTASEPVAVRFGAPSISAPGGLFIETAHPARRPIVGTGRVRVQLHESEGGLPGPPLGQPAFMELEDFVPYSMTRVGLRNTGVQLEAGQDVFVLVAPESPGDTLRVRTDEGGAQHTFTEAGSTFVPSADGEARIQFELLTGDLALAVEKVFVPDDMIVLGPAGPNPFSSHTTLDLIVREDTAVRVEVYNMLGQRVAVLFNESVSGGRTESVLVPAESWASGVYIVRAYAASGHQATRRIVKTAR
jgi:minor extracellular serine protease Vpr